MTLLFPFPSPFPGYKLWAATYTNSLTLDDARISEHLADVTSSAVLKDTHETKLLVNGKQKDRNNVKWTPLTLWLG